MPRKMQLRPVQLECKSPGCLDNKALNRSVHSVGVGQSSDGRTSHCIRLLFSQIQTFSTPRLTRALSCGAIARRHARGMQRIAVSSAKACGHCNGHARRRLRTQWQQAPAVRIRSQHFGLAKFAPTRGQHARIMRQNMLDFDWPTR